jgi:hypothetical protein
MKPDGVRLMADQIDSRAALWASVRALMVKEYGRENINRFSQRTKIPLATVGRIKSQQTSVGLPGTGISHSEIERTTPATQAEAAPENDTTNLLVGIGFIAFLFLCAWGISKLF